MADAKKILVVDDHFEMLEFLRSMLELSNQDYEVLAVPSAEEGLLELKRTHFDLLITDVRLPGMSGFDLVRQVRQLKQQVPVIMITAYSSTEGQKEAAELDVARYFRKPLDTDAVLTAVHKTLYGETTPLPQPGDRPTNEVESPLTAIENRLETLRADTGAASLVLISMDGIPVLQLGESLAQTDALAQAIAHNVHAGFELGQLMGSAEPLTIQYHSGNDAELYLVNINDAYVVAMMFDAQARRGRIGTIWVFAQRAIKDLVALLPDPATKAVTDTKPEATKTAVAPEPVSPTPATPKEPEAPEEPPASPEEIAALTELFASSDGTVAESDLDAFWSDALSDDEVTQDNLRGLSLEEAQKRGLIPSEFTQTENSEDG